MAVHQDCYNAIEQPNKTAHTGGRPSTAQASQAAGVFFNHLPAQGICAVVYSGLPAEHKVTASPGVKPTGIMIVTCLKAQADEVVCVQPFPKGPKDVWCR